MKLLTVSVAAYNVEKYLEMTLSSLMVGEKYRERLEVIVVNDGSKDGTKDIAEKYVSLCPEVFRLVDKVNGGYGSTINASIGIAEGRYFKQLDGDDWFITENLEAFLDYLESSSADLVMTKHINCYESGERKERDDVPFLTEGEILPVSALDEARYLSMHETAIRTSLLRDRCIRITEKCFYTDNEYTFFPLLEASTVAKYGKPLYCYRLGNAGQSVSVEGARKHYKDTMKVALSMYDRWSSASPKHPLTGLIAYKLLDITDSVYTYYLVGGDDNAVNELAAFDRLLRKDYPEIYALSNKTKKIRALRLSHFMLYGFVKKRVVSDWK